VHGNVKFLAGRFKVDKKAIQNIWTRALESHCNDDTYVFASLSRKLLTGYTCKYPHEEIIAGIRDIPYCKRTTYRKLAAALALPKSTVFWIAKDNRENVI
jgi:O6-methylguanine-DNA--protein-cysteine methyltransferase